MNLADENSRFYYCHEVVFVDLDDLIESGKVKVSGERKKITELLSMLDNFDFFFNVVTP